MIKYCFITDEETGLVQLGAGCPDEYYQEIGMKQRDVEQSEIDGKWYLTDKCPHYTEEEKYNLAKQDKYDENDFKASVFRYNQTFTLTVQGQECVFDTKESTQSDLNTATNYCLATQGTYDGWITNNGIELNLTLEDIALIGSVFKEKANVYDKWNEYKQAIDEAETLEEVKAIKIVYE